MNLYLNDSLSLTASSIAFLKLMSILNKCGRTISTTLWMLMRPAILLNKSRSSVSRDIPKGDLRSPFEILLSMATSTIFLYYFWSSSFIFSLHPLMYFSIALLIRIYVKSHCYCPLMSKCFPALRA